jgi:hypothetical protein
MARPLVITALLLLLLLLLPGCGSDPGTGPRADAAARRPPDGAAPTTLSVARPRPVAPGGKPAPPDPGPSPAKRREACLALYRAAAARLSTILPRFGVRRAAAELAQDYDLAGTETLRACLSLTPTQRRCVAGQADPLLPSQPCRLASSLSLTPPANLMTLLAPPRIAVDEPTGRAQLASLRGRWELQDAAGRRIELVIDARGKATFRRYRGQRPDGEAQHSTLAVRHLREVQQRRQWTTQRKVFFRLDRDSFLLSGNPLHSVTPVRSRTDLQLPVARDRVLRLAANRCEILDLGHLTAYPARCAWDKDGVTRHPTLRVRYRLGRWPLEHRYLLIRSHLVHERLYHHRYARR